MCFSKEFRQGGSYRGYKSTSCMGEYSKGRSGRIGSEGIVGDRKFYLQNQLIRLKINSVRIHRPSSYTGNVYQEKQSKTFEPVPL